MEVDVAGLLEAGPAVLQVTMPCGLEERRTNVSPGTSEQEFLMEVGEVAAVLEERVELRVDDRGKRRVQLPEDASCSQRARARIVHISARVPPELEPWREMLYWQTEVRFDAQGDFQPWADRNMVGATQTYGRSRSGAGRDRLWARCRTRNSSDWNRISEVRMVATLPGTGEVLRTETRRVNVECEPGLFGCAAAPTRTPGPLALLALVGFIVWRRRRG